MSIEPTLDIYLFSSNSFHEFSVTKENTNTLING